MDRVRMASCFCRAAPGGAAVVTALLLATLPRAAHAQPPDPALLVRLSQELAKPSPRMSYALEEAVQELDKDGNVEGTTVTISRIEADEHGKTTHTVIEKCISNG